MIKSLREFQLDEESRQKMRAAGRFNAELLDFVRPHVKAGFSTDEIDRLVHQYTVDHGHIPAPLGYHGFPKSCCTSINEVICHGIPGDEVLHDGDIVNVDVTSIVDGWHGDQSETFLIGEVSEDARRVTQCSFDSLNESIDILKPGCSVTDIGHAIVAIADQHGFSVVRDYVGHGLGLELHQPPNVPHYPDPRFERIQLIPGLCFTIEPMINVGKFMGVVDPFDNWTVRTIDGQLSAQFEHTILMTEEGPEILTQTDHGPQPGHKF